MTMQILDKISQTADLLQSLLDPAYTGTLDYEPQRLQSVEVEKWADRCRDYLRAQQQKRRA